MNEVDAAFLKRDVTYICADAIENASLPGFIYDETPDFRSGYTAAQHQFARMLRGMADNEYEVVDGHTVISGRQ